MSDRKIPTEYMEHLTRQGFELQEKIGSGLSGGVYKGTQPSLGRDVAVKFFDNFLSRRDDSLRQRFEREARILAKLQHPSIPFVITRGKVKLRGALIPYTVMQFIKGQTLDVILKREGKLDIDISVQYLRQILRALDCAHSNKIIHRDIKPSNIMVMPSDHCYVIDFSIGVSLDSSPGFLRATHAGEHLGSIDYMAPEQTRDLKTVDHRADIYSIGLVLYEMLTGRLDKTSFDKSLSYVPIALRNAAKKACEFDPNHRFQTAEDFLRSIRGLAPNRRMINDRPSKALCLNLKCPDAQWSSRGYYKGPTVIEGSTDPFCTSCGADLVYTCKECGVEFSQKPFCGNCGQRFFSVPECKQCGSFLTMNDMDTDTSKDGCSKCRSQPQSPAVTLASEPEDEIPF